MTCVYVVVNGNSWFQASVTCLQSVRDHCRSRPLVDDLIDSQLRPHLALFPLCRRHNLYEGRSHLHTCTGSLVETGVTETWDTSVLSPSDVDRTLGDGGCSAGQLSYFDAAFIDVFWGHIDTLVSCRLKHARLFVAATEGPNGHNSGPEICYSESQFRTYRLRLCRRCL